MRFDQTLAVEFTIFNNAFCLHSFIRLNSRDSILFNQICLNEEMLPNYTHTQAHIYIYTWISVEFPHTYIFVWELNGFLHKKGVNLYAKKKKMAPIAVNFVLVF